MRLFFAQNGGNKESRLMIIEGGYVMQEMTKEYVLKTLREEHLWKEGDSAQFFVMLSRRWEFTLQKEEKTYFPFEYSLRGKRLELMKYVKGDTQVWKQHFSI